MHTDTNPVDVALKELRHNNLSLFIYLFIYLFFLGGGGGSLNIVINWRETFN